MTFHSELDLAAADIEYYRGQYERLNGRPATSITVEPALVPLLVALGCTEPVENEVDGQVEPSPASSGRSEALNA